MRSWERLGGAQSESGAAATVAPARIGRAARPLATRCAPGALQVAGSSPCSPVGPLLLGKVRTAPKGVGARRKGASRSGRGSEEGWPPGLPNFAVWSFAALRIRLGAREFESPPPKPHFPSPLPLLAAAMESGRSLRSRIGRAEEGAPWTWERLLGAPHLPLILTRQSRANLAGSVREAPPALLPPQTQGALGKAFPWCSDTEMLAGV